MNLLTDKVREDCQAPKNTIKMVHMIVSTVIFLKPFDSFVLETDPNLKLHLSQFLTQSYCVSPEVLQYSAEIIWTTFCIVIWCFLFFLELRRFWTLYASLYTLCPADFKLFDGTKTHLFGPPAGLVVTIQMRFFLFIELNVIESRKSKINNINNMTEQVSKMFPLLDSTGQVNHLILFDFVKK